MEEKITLGVIGGLGPIATAHFMELVIRMTEADTDQEHLDMILYNRPSIPDRTSYILDSTKPNPLPEMIRVGNALARQGAKLIAIPCMTAHYFHRELTRYIEAPIVHAIHETAAHLKKHGITKVGIMATDGSIRSKLFQRELEQHGIEPIIPGEQAQKCVMSVIYDDVKANRPPVWTSSGSPATSCGKRVPRPSSWAARSCPWSSGITPSVPVIWTPWKSSPRPAFCAAAEN